MFLIWLLWITIVVGGGYLGGGYALEAYRGGLGVSSVLNAILFLGSAIYCLPKLLRMFVKK